MKIYQVDAFTNQPFRGNPACVCLLDEPRPEAWMLSLAAEMNLSETAFLLKEADGFNLRWFTPKKEVRLCGHATLATAHILWSENHLKPEEEARFHTLSGLLTAKLDHGWIKMNFPTRFISTADAYPALNQALGIAPALTSKNPSPQGDYYLLEANDENTLRNLTPNFERLAALSEVRAVIVTSESKEQDIDFVSRYFAPAVGVNEDPVTGSAHCYLAPYWGKKLGKTSLTGRQVSARSGLIGCEWQEERVILNGQAVTVFKGDLQV